MHTYITGGTGSGKSELIKSLIWHYLTRNKGTGLVLLTPNGDIAEQVAKFWVNLESNRLIYIEPSLDGYFPCLNPFDVPNKANLGDKNPKITPKPFCRCLKSYWAIQTLPPK